MNISVKPFRGVRVAVPYNLCLKKAEEFVHTKVRWIQKHLERMRRYESEYKDNADAADNTDRDKAKIILTRRIKHLAEKNGFHYNRVVIRNQKTRWGSCSSKNNISLNMKLVKLPDDMIDYVILHELVHTCQKNHSKAFWSELGKLVGNERQMSVRLKRYGIGLY